MIKKGEKERKEKINHAKLRKSLKHSSKREMGCCPKGGETEKCPQPVPEWPLAPEFGVPRAEPL